MKNILTLGASLFILGCANSSMPEFPSVIRAHYMVEVREEPLPFKQLESIVNPQDIMPMPTQQVARCLHFDIISKTPYKIKFLGEEPMLECNGVGGYRPDDSIMLLNWIDDISAWAKTKRKCFK